MQNKRTYSVILAALLCAIGVAIPMFSPLKIILEPASFTLGSHVAIFIAVFISAPVAVAVSLGTALGFFLGGFPLVVVLRATSQVVFALVGGVILQKYPSALSSVKGANLFSLGIALLHALGEIAVVMPFYFGNSMAQAYYTQGFVNSVVLLVGVGTLVHSMVDFYIAFVIWKAIRPKAPKQPESSLKA